METKKEWSDLSSKEKLDYVFIIVAIVGFTLGAMVNLKLLTRK